MNAPAFVSVERERAGMWFDGIPVIWTDSEQGLLPNSARRSAGFAHDVCTIYLHTRYVSEFEQFERSFERFDDEAVSAIGFTEAQAKLELETDEVPKIIQRKIPHRGDLVIAELAAGTAFSAVTLKDLYVVHQRTLPGDTLIEVQLADVRVFYPFFGEWSARYNIRVDRGPSEFPSVIRKLEPATISRELARIDPRSAKDQTRAFTLNEIIEEGVATPAWCAGLRRGGPGDPGAARPLHRRATPRGALLGSSPRSRRPPATVRRVPTARRPQPGQHDHGAPARPR